MDFESNGGVLERLLTKRDLLRSGDDRHQQIRPLLISLSGTNRGAFGSGQNIALEEHELSHVFDWAVGISAGGPIAAYLLAEQARRGSTIYCEECASPRFISLKKRRVDVDYIASVFRSGAKALNQDAVRNSRTELHMAATCAETGEGLLLDAKTPYYDVVEAIRATIAIPGLGGPPLVMHGRAYTDGAGALTFPTKMLIERFDPTDILVMANRPEEFSEGLGREIVFRYATAGLPRDVRRLFLSMARRFDDGLGHLRSNYKGRYGILWCDSEVATLERNRAKLTRAVEKAHIHLNGLLAAAARPS